MCWKIWQKVRVFVVEFFCWRPHIVYTYITLFLSINLHIINLRLFWYFFKVEKLIAPFYENKVFFEVFRFHPRNIVLFLLRVWEHLKRSNNLYDDEIWWWNNVGPQCSVQLDLNPELENTSYKYSWFHVFFIKLDFFSKVWGLFLHG